MRNYFDMSQIPGDKIKIIIDEALEGRYDTFDKTMAGMGGAIGMVASDLVTKNARNALVCIAELKRAFLEYEINWHDQHDHHHHPDYQKMIDELIRKFKDLVERMFTQFFQTTANWKSELMDGYIDGDKKVVADAEVKFSALKAENENRIREINELRIDTDNHVKDLEERNVALEKRVEAMERKIEDLEKVKVELTNLLDEKLMNLEFEIKLMKQANI